MREPELTPFLQSTIYGYSKYDFLMSNVENIGINGENLTIVILSYNRSQATVTLLKSIEKCIPNFAGKILIADNGSTKADIKLLESYVQKSPHDVEIVHFDKNYGVAGGRNRIVDYVQTEWFMSLDNDIYLIENPLPQILETIAMLGVKFLNLPLISDDKKTVFSNGGSLFTDYSDEGPLLGGGSLFTQCKIDDVSNLKPTLSTFLLGGASVLNKEEFIRCGMYDENMFIGFEDLDFSLTLFNMGLKIGNCPVFSLVHDHTIKTDKESLEYEKTRFNNGILKQSAEYLEKKWGFRVWNANTEMWIKLRQKDLGIEVKEEIIQEVNRKPHIALIVDVKGWCFWNIACKIVENLSDFYDFEIIPLDQLDNNIVKALFYTRSANFDLIHVFWRGHLSFFKSLEYYMNLCGLDYKNFMQIYVEWQYITTSVYDHLYLDDLKFTNNMLSTCKNYTVSSQILKDIYDKEKNIIKKPQMVVTDGVDLSLFKPKNLSRFKKHEKLVVGWVGNSAWQQEDGSEDFKGFNTILKPVLKELIDEGYPIECLFADRQCGMIAHEDMPDYYAKIDVCLCASKIEGTPNPVLESMACGVPIITTEVGIVREAFGIEQQEFIVNRTKKDFKKSILRLVENRDILKKLSQENLKQIEAWDWTIKTNDFKVFFDENLKKARTVRDGES